MIRTLDNGNTWAFISPSPFNNTQVNGVTYGTKFVTVGNSGKGVYMTDSLSITTLELISDIKFGTSNIYDVAYGGGKFVAVSDEANSAYSTDGITWTSIEDYFYSTSIGRTRFNTITYGNNRFVAGNSNTAAYWITP